MKRVEKIDRGEVEADAEVRQRHVGARQLGPELFEREAGHFWGLLETRPYLRARLGLAHSLWTAARREKAVRHLQEMLRLKPGDKQLQAGRLGTFEIQGDNVLLGKPFAFTKENIDQFDF